MVYVYFIEENRCGLFGFAFAFFQWVIVAKHQLKCGSCNEL